MAIYLKQFSEVDNIGDVLSARVVAGISGLAVRTIGEAAFDGANLIAAGSIAHWSDENSTLWGCGLVNDWIGPNGKPARVLAVRGKLTRDRLASCGIPCGDLFGDPGLLVPEFIAPSLRKHALGLVPHYVDRENAFVQECRSAGAVVLDVSAAPERFVESLTSCEGILSSSLHGIVLAHAYGIPAAWIRISGEVHGDGFKFFDYYSSLGLKRADVQMLTPGPHSLEEMAGRCWKPASVGNLAQLRSSLVEALPQLDITPAVVPTA